MTQKTYSSHFEVSEQLKRIADELETLNKTLRSVVYGDKVDVFDCRPYIRNATSFMEVLNRIANALETAEENKEIRGEK